VSAPALWSYRAYCTNVVDGDTLDVVIDLGFGVTMAQRVRLAHVDTPERGQPNWSEARRFIMDRVWVTGYQDPTWPLRLVTIKPHDKYGRYLAEVWVDGKSLGDELLAAGLAVPYEGGAR
jgi:micrococcal nuclease